MINADGLSPGRPYIYLLGRFEVHAGEGVIIDHAWPRRKAKALIKLLALQANRSLHREQVYEAIWPDLDRRAAANNVRKNLHYLRSAFDGTLFDEPLVCAQGDMLALPDAWIDVDAFRELAQAARGSSDPQAYNKALALYEGDLLPEDLYEEWTREQREELRGLRHALLLGVGSLYISQGDGEQAAVCARQAIAADPYDEDAHRLLMRAYVESAQPGRALRHYDTLLARLQNELGTGPSSATTDLRDAIRQPANADTDLHERIAAARDDVQFAETADGVTIAYARSGSGPPLIHLPWIPGPSLRIDAEYPELLAWFDELASRWSLVRYDGRGTGLSQRDIQDASLDAHIRDLDAVVQRSGVDQVSLVAVHHAGPVAIAYAVRHPERVAALILWSTYASARDYSASSLTEARSALLQGDFRLYVQASVNALFDWDAPEQATRYANLALRSVGPEVGQNLFRGVRSFDVADEVSRVQAPTLVLQRRGIAYPPLAVARNLAASIPNARVAVLEGSVYAPYMGDVRPVLAAIDSFQAEVLGP